MKTPPEYLTQALATQQADHQAQGYCPLSFDEPATRFVLRATAEAAVALALEEAERYKNNVVGAVLRSHPSTPQADVATPPDAL